ncbi:MAG: hypothetical protein JW832_15370 [Deltaproteobacteria bacterium]|nr:hypothetical protein [Deltaproteobacteria bacterium]
MGIDCLEEKFQRYRERHPENMDRLRELAEETSDVQARVRELMDAITPELCSACIASCCKCMPVDGWFTESDYFLYRMLHEAPLHLRRHHADGRSCTFLGDTGCVLPGAMRSFPCVKVNCKMVAEALETNGRLAEFMKLYDEMSRLQEEVWPLLADCLSPTIMQAQQL